MGRSGSASREQSSARNANDTYARATRRRYSPAATIPRSASWRVTNKSTGGGGVLSSGPEPPPGRSAEVGSGRVARPHAGGEIAHQRGTRLWPLPDHFPDRAGAAQRPPSHQRARGQASLGGALGRGL